MSKTITLRLEDEVYQLLRALAEQDNRPISNFIETAALRYVEESQMTDEFETEEIAGNRKLQASLKRGLRDARNKRGRFA